MPARTALLQQPAFKAHQLCSKCGLQSLQGAQNARQGCLGLYLQSSISTNHSYARILAVMAQHACCCLGCAFRMKAGQLIGDAMRDVRSCRNNDGHKRGFIATMDAVNKELGAESGPFFLGSEVSLPDVVGLQQSIARPHLEPCSVAGQAEHFQSTVANWVLSASTKPPLSTFMGFPTSTLQKSGS